MLKNLIKKQLKRALSSNIAKALDNSSYRFHLLIATIVAAIIVVQLALIKVFFFGHKKIHTSTEDIAVQDTSYRNDIIDRNGKVLARNIYFFDVYVNPSEIFEPIRNLNNLSEVFPDMSDKEKQSILKVLGSNKKGWVLLKRAVTPKQKRAVINFGLPGYYFEEKTRAVYPYSNLTSHVVGIVSDDNKGLTGTQNIFQERLTDPNSTPLRLCIDIQIQSLIREIMIEEYKHMKALGAVAIMMNVDNGEIISMVSLPDFNPNLHKKANKDDFFNRATLGVYELGSIFKIFTIAMALQHGIPAEKIYNISQPIKVGTMSINDYHRSRDSVNLTDTLVYSSNLGAAQIARDVGVKNQIDFFKKLGFLRRAEIDLPERGWTIYPRITSGSWSDAALMTIAFGHGIAISPMHLVTGVSSVVNGGKIVKPKLVCDIKDEFSKKSTPQETIVTPEVSKELREMLREVVVRGSGKRSNIASYRVGGKTSTAEKIINNKYSKDKTIAAFVGVFPIDNPKYSLLVLIDEPFQDKARGVFGTGGFVAAPIVGKIISVTGPILGIQSDIGTESGVTETVEIE